MSLVKRHPLITFFVLVYALAWFIESPLVFLQDSIIGTQGQIFFILSANVPSVVAIVLTGVVFGRAALRKLLGRLLIWRVNPLWYLVVLLGPVVLVGGAVGLNTLLGAPPLTVGTTLLGGVIMMTSVIAPAVPQGEEIWWIRDALPRLQTGTSTL